MLRKNIVANFLGRTWGFVSLYLFVPLYLKFLGIEAYALVGFYTTMLGVLSFADMGFTATLNREMARLSAQPNGSRARQNLLRTYEAAYAGLAILLILAVVVCAPLISGHWLNAKTMPTETLTEVIRWMGIAIAFQLTAGLFSGALMGLQRQVESNLIQVGSGIFRSVGGVLVLWLVSPTIQAFALWQVVANLAFLLVARHSAWKAVVDATLMVRPRVTMDVIRTTWRYALGMSGLTAISTLLIQADKLVASKVLPLEELGYYLIAGTLATLPVTVATPIAMAIFPRFTELLAQGNEVRLTSLYHRATELLALLIIPLSLTIVFCASQLTFLWTGSAEAAQQVKLTAAFLALGQLCQALILIPYYLALAHGKTGLNLKIGIASLLILAPLLGIFIVKHGALGGSMAWLLMNLIIMPLYMTTFHRKMLRGEMKRWYTRSVIIPIVSALPVVMLGAWLLPWTDSRVETFGGVFLIWAVSTAIVLATSPEMRLEAGRVLNRLPRIRTRHNV